MYELVLSVFIGLGLLLCLYDIIQGEAVIIFSFIALELKTEKVMHPAFCVIVGIVVAVLFVILMYHVKIVRYVLSVVLSGVVAALVWYEAHTKLDKTWTIVLTVVGFIIALGLHGYSYYREMGDTSDNIYADLRGGSMDAQKNAETINQINDTLRKKYEEQKQREYEQSVHNAKYDYYKEYYETHKDDVVNDSQTDYYEELFDGCSSMEDLKKRYRELLKIFHPDAQNGSQEKTQAIMNAYEKIISERF
ncbi:hypothetical protein H8S00_01805 [Eubacterium sp. BX4]|uniref:J domain-containing protein n=1 Tax=Eubacterium segne TaxID=2763045 RepID=A0ABR7EZF9_9FIRM|nr:hypothetical protein [Eubacterium segne]MBC5666731.1 hypothetical protein [Eubacterium segne]